MQPNLLSPAGVWAGSDEDGLVERVASRLQSKNILNDAGLEVSYQAFKWMCNDYWRKMGIIYNDIKTNQDAYIVTCRPAFIAGVLPFQFEKSQQQVYRKLYEIAMDYRDRGRRIEFFQFLQEGQCYINIWTAFFLLEVFDLDKTAKLKGWNDQECIFNYHYKTIENTFQSFNDKSQIINCSYWLEEKRSKTLYL